MKGGEIRVILNDVCKGFLSDLGFLDDDNYHSNRLEYYDNWIVYGALNLKRFYFRTSANCLRLEGV